MNVLLIALITLFAMPPAFAQSTQGVTMEGACRLVETHVPRADVAHVGDSAVPADLNAVDGGLGTVHIPITIDLAARFGIDVPVGAELEPEVAVIAVEPDGRVLYNGQDLSRNVATVCGQMHATDGQRTKDALGSNPTQ